MKVCRSAISTVDPEIAEHFLVWLHLQQASPCTSPSAGTNARRLIEATFKGLAAAGERPCG